MTKHASVDDYFASLADDRRAPMEALRRAVREAAPHATECIAYNMPALRIGGRFLVSYDAYKNHYSLFPWSDAMLDALGDDLRRYAAGKGTIQFPRTEPIPVDLVRRVVEFRVSELAGST